MATQSFGVTVIRPDDLLLLRLDFIDVDVTPAAGGGPATVQGRTGALVVVHFQPQHVAEEAFWQSGNATPTKAEQEAGTTGPLAGPLPPNYPPPPGQVRSILAGPTRLVFTVPAGRSFPLTVEGVLAAIQELPLQVPPLAAYEMPAGCAGLPPALLPLFFRPAPPKIEAPGADETAIEVPFKLILSPDSFGKWEHATKSVEHDGRVELWHTRLGSRRGAGGDPRVRAVWSPDYHSGDPQPHTDDDPFRSSLDGRDRNEIVRLTSDYYIDFIGNYPPTPVATHRFMLTGLGAWLDVQGDWQPPRLSETRSLTVEEWRHLATLGRDHYVRVVYAGFLFPFRHRASLVKITERKLAFKDGGYVAYNFQRMFILVRERVRSYPDRDIPFRSIEITTVRTPDLAPPGATAIPGTPPQSAFWPSLPPEFQFECIGTDWEGRKITFTTPLIFIDKDAEGAHFQTAINYYNGLLATDARRCRPMLGQKIAFAPPSKPGDTTEETIDLTFGAKNQVDVPRFRPFMFQASTDNPALEQLASGPALTVEWEQSYLKPTGNQIDNAGEVFLRVKPGLPMKFPHEKAGGLITPDMTITTISRALGPMGGRADDLRDGKMKPGDVFAGVTLMGGITLDRIIKVIQTPNAADPDVAGKKLPQFVTVRDDVAKVIRTTYSWTLSRNELWDDRELEPPPKPSESVLLWRDHTSTLKLTATLTRPFDPAAEAIFETTGEITNFQVVLLPSTTLARLNFNRISFRARTGEKLDTSVDFAGIEFDGILRFVNELQKVIPMDGFSDPPSVQLVTDPAGVNVGFTLGLPSIGVGIMTMQNVSLSAGFYLPFIGTEVMNFRFAFCERHQPFILTVSLFGGGGFFAINLGLKGVVSIEASLEFGASIALNLGVASGQATIMAGFYFKMKGKDFELTGYFRACGALSVLGIITVSVEFYLGLTYATKGMEKHPGKLWGQATLTVKIKIVFFSISVGVSLEREFAGSDPTFRRLMPASDWKLYCDAFDDYPGVPGD